MQGEQRPGAKLIKHFHSLAGERRPLDEGCPGARFPPGRPLSSCPEKRSPEDGQRSLCLTLLNKSGRALGDELEFSEACCYVWTQTGSPPLALRVFLFPLPRKPFCQTDTWLLASQAASFLILLGTRFQILFNSINH